MPISSNLVTATQTRIDAVTSSCCANDFALAATAATEMSCYDSNRKVSVATVNDLPSTETTGIGPGHIVFVESINVPVMSYEEGWMGLDRRILRKDKPDLKLWSWGININRQLGTGNTTNYSSPVTTAGGGTTWCQVSGGYIGGAGIKTDGTLWVWGTNTNGNLGTGNATQYASPVTTAGGGTNWKQVSNKAYYASIALKTDGTLWTWGNNNCGQLGNNNKTVYSSPVTTVAGGTNWCCVTSGIGAMHLVALKTDGTLWSWGANSKGQLGTGNTTPYSSPVTTAGGGTNWCAASSGGYHVAALKTDGTLWTWGWNAYSALGTQGGDRSSPATVSGGGTNWCKLSVDGNGWHHNLALKTDGTLWTWGVNTYGQLGDGSTNSRLSPVTVAGGGTNWCHIAGGGYHSTALKTDGTLWTWGNNNCGQLGTNSLTCYSSPVTVIAGGTTWTSSSAGHSSSHGITATY